MRALLAPVVEELRSLRIMVARFVLVAPGPFRPRAARRKTEEPIVKYDAELPTIPPDLKDYMGQIFKVTRVEDGVEVFSEEYPLDGSVLFSNEFDVDDAKEYELSCAYFDDATPRNVGPASTQRFVAHDNVPPDAPGPFGAVRMKSE